MNAIDPGPIWPVECHASGGRWTLVLHRDLAHPPAKVWAALTEPGQLARWAPYLADRDLGSTGAATLTMIDGEHTEDLSATVQRAEPPHLLVHTWGEDLLRWELAPTAGGTRLTLRHTMADRDWVPKVAAGWHLCLVVAGHLLDGDPVPPIRGHEAKNHGWVELDEAYSRELGIATDEAP
ncbi:SRPBCC family protein [Catellatospora vulcania]|uniref:SRPBCC family protein n=1 Tax=Catellatospora vulcania TaxID=1460450 RepID=UPI0012D408D7|nr:SRPBCC family protein [Catellatospora vulcania]